MWSKCADWETIRTNINFTPLPLDIIPIKSYDIVNSPYGRFRTIKSKTIYNEIFWEGEFIDWKLTNSKYAKGTVKLSQLKNPNIRQIYCNDCTTNSTTKYHFYGLECKKCGSFNTQV